MNETSPGRRGQTDRRLSQQDLDLSVPIKFIPITPMSPEQEDMSRKLSRLSDKLRDTTSPEEKGLLMDEFASLAEEYSQQFGA